MRVGITNLYFVTGVEIRKHMHLTARTAVSVYNLLRSFRPLLEGYL